jgi:4-aminobutyrate aminotransferase
MGGRLADVWFRSTDLDVVSGAGCWVTASDGTRYLDGTSGIAVTSTGHCHPRVVAAIQEQAARFVHAQVNVYRHDLLQRLADRLEEVTPAGIDTFFLTNSGAEATEAAVKLAKQATGRPHVVVFDGSFHGRTHLAMAMTTSKYGYRAGYAPLPAGVFVAPFPHGDADVDRCLAGFDRLLATQTAPVETAAVVIEPVLGEGGYRPAPAAFLHGLADRCRTHGILFVADEVQTGFGRTGTMFAVDRIGLQPDVLVMAKGIASGFPISAVGASAPLMDRWPTGSHGGTYGGNPIGCAAALATIDVLTEPGFLDAVEARGAELRAGLEALAAADPGLVDVRGPGLMVGCDLVDPATGAPDAVRTAAVLRHCQTEGHLLLMSCGTAANTVRWMLPLVVSADEVATGLAAFGAALAATRQAR